MDCRHWESLLDAMLKGELSPESRRGAEEHLASCQACGELFAAALASSTSLDGVEAESLTADILSLTSGSPCAESQGLMPDFVDGVLPAEEKRLLSSHLEGCRECRELAAILAWATPVLPTLAALAPDDRFAGDVLAAMDAEARGEAEGAGIATSRLRAWWQRTWQRPLFPLEAAYLGVLLLVALMGTPYSPLKSAPPRILALFQTESAALAAPLPMDLSPWVGPAINQGESWLGQGRTQVRETKQNFFADLVSRRQRVSPFFSDLWQHFRELWRALREGDFSTALIRLSNIAGDCQRIREAWQGKGIPADAASDTGTDATSDMDTGNDIDSSSNPETRRQRPATIETD